MNSEPTPEAGSAAFAPGSPLRTLETLARKADAPALAREAAALAERISEGRFYVAVVGQFKRGKSTLINALVGESVLPAGVVPVTAVVTVVRHGPRRAARVRMADGAWRDVDPSDLAAFVSEEGQYLGTLLYTNGTRIENDFKDRVVESRRLLESEIRARLREVYASAERALERARARLSAGGDAVKVELERIDNLRRQAVDLLTNSKGETS